MLFYDAVSAEKQSDPDFEKDYKAYIEIMETRDTVERLMRNAFEEMKKLRL